MCNILFLFKDATALFMCQSPLDSKAINISEPWLCSDMTLGRDKGFQKTPHSLSPGHNTLTLSMICEQDSTDLGLSPNPDKYDLNKPRQGFNFSGFYMAILERGSPSSPLGFKLDNRSNKFLFVS